MTEAIAQIIFQHDVFTLIIAPLALFAAALIWIQAKG